MFLIVRFTGVHGGEKLRITWVKVYIQRYHGMMSDVCKMSDRDNCVYTAITCLSTPFLRSDCIILENYQPSKSNLYLF